MTHLVTTPAERAALPVGHVVVSASGTVACRATQEHGVVFGNSRTFPWNDLALPLTVLYPATAPELGVLTAEQVEKAEAAAVEALESGSGGEGVPLFDLGVTVARAVLDTLALRATSTEVQWAIVYDGLSEDDIEPVTEHQARVWASLPMFDGQDVLVSRDAAYGSWRKTL